MDVASDWKRIQAWHHANTPPETLTLAEGADEAEIAFLEQEIGFRLPDDLRASFALHNGSGESFLLHHGELLSLASLRDQWARMILWQKQNGWGQGDDYKSKLVDPAIKPIWWNPSRLPLTDNSGDHVFADFDPTEHGKPGQILAHSHETGPEKRLAISFGAWLNSIADDLEAGKYVYNEDEETVGPPEVFDDYEGNDVETEDQPEDR